MAEAAGVGILIIGYYAIGLCIFGTLYQLWFYWRNRK